MSVTPIRPDLAPTPLGSQMIDSVVQAVKRFEAEVETGPPSAIVWVVVNDAGEFRYSWDARSSALPATAVIGMAIAALIGPPPCNYD